ncbi:MAG: hypothetical protein IGS03_00645 [Candidatus Sericytochromatia bacterium]|nr:hypothetical protein [Candidatus Sericytochromatia bacterium]
MRVPFAQPVTVTRYVAGTRSSKGRYTPGAAAPVVVRMLIQPLGFNSDAVEELADQMGVRHLSGRLRIYAEAELMTGEKASSTQADRLSYQGQVYEIQEASLWPGRLPHWRCTAKLVDEKTP